MWIQTRTGLYIKLQCMNEGVQEEDSWLNGTIWYKYYQNYSRRVWLQIWGAHDESWRCGQYSQLLWNLHILIVWFCSVLKTTIHSLGYSYILFHNFQIVEKHWWTSHGAPRSPSLCIQPIWEHVGECGRISAAVQSGEVVQLWLPNHSTFCWCHALNFYLLPKAAFQSIEWFSTVLEVRILWSQWESIVKWFLLISRFQVFEQPVQSAWSQTKEQQMYYIGQPKSILIWWWVWP